MSAILTITEGNHEVTANVPGLGFFEGVREDYDNLSHKDAMLHVDAFRQENAEFGEAFDEFRYDYDRDTLRIVTRIIASAWHSDNRASVTNDEWDGLVHIPNRTFDE